MAGFGLLSEQNLPLSEICFFVNNIKINIGRFKSTSNLVVGPLKWVEKPKGVIFKKFA